MTGLHGVKKRKASGSPVRWRGNGARDETGRCLRIGA